MLRFFSIFIILSFLSSSTVLSQSCIIYKKEKDGIFIGADTRMVSYESNETTRQIEPVYSSICKMGSVNNICFAITGFGADIAMSEAKNIFLNTKLFSDAIKKYVESVGQKIADILETERRQRIAFFKRTFPRGSNVGGSVFLYYENGALMGHVINISVISHPTEKATVTTRNEIIDSIGIAGSSIGIKNVVFNKDVWKKGAVKGINNLLSIEKIANPTEVGGVADILFVSTKNEIEWVQRKKCQ